MKNQQQAGESFPVITGVAFQYFANGGRVFCKQVRGEIVQDRCRQPDVVFFHDGSKNAEPGRLIKGRRLRPVDSGSSHPPNNVFPTEWLKMFAPAIGFGQC